MRSRKVMAGSIMLALASPATADISFAQRITVDAAGGMAMFGSEGSVLTQISGDKSRSESTMQMKSKLASMMAGGGRTATIVRLDRELTWQLDAENEKYSEATFAQTRQQMQEARESMQGNDGQLPVSEEGCEWSEAEINVEHPRGSEDVAGIKTSKHIIRMEQSCKDPESGNVCDITWLMETWMAKKVPGQKEAEAFRDGYAKALGMDETFSQLGGPAQGLLGMYADNWDDVTAELEKVKGFPLKMNLQMGIGGAQCTTASGEPISMDETWSDASTAVYDNALNSMQDSITNSIGNSIASSLGGGKAGAAAGRLVKGLGGMFGGAKSQEPEPEPDPAPAPQPAAPAEGDQQITLFRVSTEMTSWSEVSIPTDRFDIPPGWSKQ